METDAILSILLAYVCFVKSVYAPSTQSSENHLNVREERLWATEGMEDTERTQPAESTKQSSYWLTETKATSKAL